MVDVQRVKVMTQLAAFEEKESKRALKIVNYYRRDYVCMKLLKIFVCVTIGYAFLLVLFGAYQWEYLIGNAMNLDYVLMIKKIAVGYISLLTCYFLIGVCAYNIQYSKAKRKVKEYDRKLHLLRRLYQREQEKN